MSESSMRDLLEGAIERLEQSPLAVHRLEAAIRRRAREVERFVKMVEAARYLRHQLRELEAGIRELEPQLAEALRPLLDEVYDEQGMKPVEVPLGDRVLVLKPQKRGTSVVINEAALTEHDKMEMLKRGLARTKTVWQPDKKAIKQAIERGEVVPHCELKTERKWKLEVRRKGETYAAPLPEPQPENETAPETPPDLDEIVWD